MRVLRGIAGLCKDAVVARLPSMLGFLVTHRRDVIRDPIIARALAGVWTDEDFTKIHDALAVFSAHGGGSGLLRAGARRHPTQALSKGFKPTLAKPGTTLRG
jgi:hypothetical protein